MVITIVAKAMIFILMGYTVSGNHIDADLKTESQLNRHRDVGQKKNLRVVLVDAKSKGDEATDKEKLEEDEELWERILRNNLSITPPPSPRPTTSPTRLTLMPTDLPIMEEDEECELMVNVECVEVEGNSRIPCGQVPQPSDEPECVKNVEYVYRITNSCDPSLRENCDSATVRTFDIVRNGVLKSLLSLVPQNSRIAPTETVFYIESGVEFDFCSSQTVDTNVRVIADTAPGMEVGICSAEASNFFTIGFVPDLPCRVAIDLSCFIEDGNDRINCKDIPMPEENEDCIKEVVYATIVTNVGEKRKTILSLDRTRDGDSADLIGLLNKRDLAPGEFAVAREEGQVLDFCEQRLVTTIVEVESEAFGVGQLECFEQATLVFSIAITCDVDVMVECFADPSRDFSVPCSSFNPFDSQSLMVGCEHVHKYVYTITNTGPGDEVIESLVVTRDGITNNILEKRFNLDPDEVREINEFQLVDYCQEFPNGITTEVEVIADMFPLGGSCSDNDSITIIPAMEECNVALNPLIRCTVEAPDGSEVLCSVYHEQIKDLGDREQCMREVTFEYTLVNEGLACLLIYSVTAEIDNQGSFDLTPAMGKTLCPEESLVVVQTHVEDFCDEDLEDRVVVIVNDGPPETCGGYGALGFFPPEVEEECIIDLELTCATSVGEDCVVVTQEPTQETCDFHPSYIDLKYTAGSCSSSDNSQHYVFVCHDSGDVSTLSNPFITAHSFHGVEYFSDTIQIGETLRLGNSYPKLDEVMVVKVYDAIGGNLVQKFKFDSTCSKPLRTNDVFGAFTLTGLGNKKHSISASSSSAAISGAEFEFTFNIVNNGETDAFLKDIVLSSGDTQLTSIDLTGNTIEIGRTYTNSEVIDLSFITEPSDVSITASANSPFNLECRASDAVTVEYESRGAEIPNQTLCLDCPKSYLFKFISKTCEESRNSQDIHCTDKAPIFDPSSIVITDDQFKHIFFEGEVRRGSIFEVIAGHSSFKTDLVVKVIHGGNIAQIIKFHASCNKPIFLGDSFGSIEVVGWKNSKQGLVTL